MDITLGYWASELSQWQSKNILAAYKTAIESLVYTPEQNIEELQLVGGEQMAQIQRWNAKSLNALQSCIHEVFAENVRVRQNETALSSVSAIITYGQLDVLSTQLGSHLVSLGVGPEFMVPLCFEKSVWTIVSLMAVLKAGGAFVLLDPKMPTQRLRDIVNDLDAHIGLSSVLQAGQMQSLLDTNIIVDQSIATLLPQVLDQGSICPSVKPDNAAYVIFTSGTTGKPKGIVIPHSAFCSSASAHGRQLRIDSSSRVLQFAAYNWDASILEILTTLMHGGCVCVPDEHSRLNGVVSFVNEQKINWALLTPSFALSIDPTGVPGLKTLVLGGEKMSERDVQRWSPETKLINAYGPSETSVIASVNPTLQRNSPANIGWAVGGVFWIVDSNDHNKLAPVGCIGELLVEGPTLARGYLNDAVKTSAAFVENLTWATAHAGMPRRLYKTGDLGIYNPDGSVTYIGRKDSQIKLHGQRIEVGEIEQNLLADSRVKNAMVMLPDRGWCNKRLVAVISLQDVEDTKNASKLNLVDAEKYQQSSSQLKLIRQLLTERIPLYMVPSTWAIVETLPLHVTGKLDRPAISRWLEDMAEDTYQRIMNLENEGNIGPSTQAERILQNVVGRVLNLPVENVGMNRSFLSLGGDSITAMQVVSHSRAEGVLLAVQDVLQRRSISELAALATPSTKTVLAAYDDVNVPFGLSPIQQMYFSMMDGKANHFNQSMFLRVTRRIEFQDLRAAVNEVVQHHSMLRARFTQLDGKWSQYIADDVETSYRLEVHDVSDDAGMTSVIAKAQDDIDVAQGPIFAAHLIHLAKHNQVLFLVAHHLVVDLVSWRNILQDLEDLLESGKLLLAKPYPFQPWVKLQTEHAKKFLTSQDTLRIPEAIADMAYWGMTDVPNLYKDVTTTSFILDTNLTELLLGPSLKALSTDVTDIFMATLLRAFNVVFVDRETPTIFSEGHGRETWEQEIDISRTVGWFTTLTPIYVSAPKGNQLKDILCRTKDIRRKSGHGLNYLASRFLNGEQQHDSGDRGPIELLFNYLGRYQQLERQGGLLQQGELPKEASLMDVGREVTRMALFEASAVVMHGVTEIRLVYNRHIQKLAEVETWVHEWEDCLREAVVQLVDMEEDRSLSDFPYLQMTYEGLELLKTDRLKKLGIARLSEVEDVYPCSPMQQGLLLSQSRDPRHYETRFAFELTATQEGRLIDGDRLARAWQEVVNRHSALRTVFIESVSEGGLADQVVLKNVTPNTSRLHCNDKEVLDRLSMQHSSGYDDSQPPHHLTLCETTSGKVYIQMEINHALIDASSLSILTRDLTLAYEGELPQGSGPLYSAYIEYLQHQPIHRSLDYWTQYLSNLTPCLFPSYAERDTVGHLHTTSVDLELRPGSLASFCESHGFTIANVVQAVWGLVLRVFTNSDDVCFGYLVSGRDTAVEGVEEIVGPFINMVVCRMSLANTRDVSQLVEAVKLDYLESLKHQHCSLADIQHKMGLSGRPIFNTIMSIQRVASNIPYTPALSFKSVGSHDPTEVRATRILY